MGGVVVAVANVRDVPHGMEPTAWSLMEMERGEEEHGQVLFSTLRVPVAPKIGRLVASIAREAEFGDEAEAGSVGEELQAPDVRVTASRREDASAIRMVPPVR
jgi:hypothetical protein